jgi:hypothetical protein
LAAVAVETPHGCERPLRPLPRATKTDIELWEVHSELILVCPEVWKRALELLPERDPDAFLAGHSATVFAAEEAHSGASLPVAVVGYTLWRLAETGRSALWMVGAVIALALLAQVVHS